MECLRDQRGRSQGLRLTRVASRDLHPTNDTANLKEAAMSSPELTSFDIDLLELLEIANGKRRPRSFVSLRRRAAVFCSTPRIVEALAYRLTEDRRKKSRTACDPLIEDLVLGGEIERATAGHFPVRGLSGLRRSTRFTDFVHSANPVPYGEGFTRLNDDRSRDGNFAEQGREGSGGIQQVPGSGQSGDPPEDPLNS